MQNTLPYDDIVITCTMFEKVSNDRKLIETANFGKNNSGVISCQIKTLHHHLSQCLNVMTSRVMSCYILSVDRRPEIFIS